MITIRLAHEHCLPLPYARIAGVEACLAALIASVAPEAIPTHCYEPLREDESKVGFLVEGYT
jgi:hypothetical protein